MAKFRAGISRAVSEPADEYAGIGILVKMKNFLSEKQVAAGKVVEEPA